MGGPDFVENTTESTQYQDELDNRTFTFPSKMKMCSKTQKSDLHSPWINLLAKTPKTDIP